MLDRTSSARGSLLMLFLGLPGVTLWLGGLWLCYTAALFHILYPGDWDIMYTPAQQKRLIIIYCIVPFTPIIGYTMIVLASVLSGFDRYRLPPRQAVALACFDAGQQFLILLALCQLIMMGPWGVYDFMSPTVLISSGILIILFLILRRYAKGKQRKWRRLRQYIPQHLETTTRCAAGFGVLPRSAHPPTSFDKSPSSPILPPVSLS